MIAAEVSPTPKNKIPLYEIRIRTLFMKPPERIMKLARTGKEQPIKRNVWVRINWLPWFSLLSQYLMKYLLIDCKVGFVEYWNIKNRSISN